MEQIKLRTSLKDAGHFQDCPEDYSYTPEQFNPFQYSGPHDIAHDLRLIHTRLPEINAALDSAAKWEAVEGALMEFHVMAESWMAGTFLRNADGSLVVDGRGRPVSGASRLPDAMRNLSAALTASEKARVEMVQKARNIATMYHKEKWAHSETRRERDALQQRNERLECEVEDYRNEAEF
jgi:Sec-independent protein translocase protein TatA